MSTIERHRNLRRERELSEWAFHQVLYLSPYTGRLMCAISHTGRLQTSSTRLIAPALPGRRYLYDEPAFIRLRRVMRLDRALTAGFGKGDR
jgi:hypothetical protein